MIEPLNYLEDTTIYYPGDSSTKLMGQFEDEYAGKNYNNGYFVAKKEYMCLSDTSYCAMLKGLSKNNFYLLNDLSSGIYLSISNKK